MYIKSAHIKNIRSIEDFEITFDEPAGWHVLIGDNGSGKSTIIRSLALALVGAYEAQGLPDNWENWLKHSASSGSVSLALEQHDVDKMLHEVDIFMDISIQVDTHFQRRDGIVFISDTLNKTMRPYDSSRTIWRNSEGWFSVAYGPYRRFTGGDSNMSPIFQAKPRLGAHLSAFSESVALTEPIEWLIKLNHQEVERMNSEMVRSGLDKRMDLALYEFFEKAVGNNIDLKEALTNNKENFVTNTVDTIMKSLLDEETIRGIETADFGILTALEHLINSSHFLPNNTKLDKISSEGVFFKDGNGNLITINQLSDGYRSILSLTLELIRQLIRVYGEDAVFENIRKDDIRITLPGVVLIDEIDAHLHPTWQTKIGQWFLKYFPNLQFIVTTHSPLVCRAAIKGTIWKLAEPGSGEKSKEITGIDKARIVYGNLIEAYGTEAFEQDVSASENAQQMRKELADLSKKSFKGIITDTEKKRMNRIQEILPTS